MGRLEQCIDFFQKKILLRDNFKRPPVRDRLTEEEEGEEDDEEEE